jgi:hypothetical protein
MKPRDAHRGVISRLDVCDVDEMRFKNQPAAKASSKDP